MTLTNDQRVLLAREAALIRDAYERHEVHTDHSRKMLKERFEEIDRLLKSNGEELNQSLLCH